MRVFRDIAIRIDNRRIIKLLGHRRGMKIHKSLLHKIDASIEKAMILMEPSLASERLTVFLEKNDEILCDQEFKIHGPKIVDFIRGCSYLTLYTATIGPVLEEVEDLARARGLLTEALILDTISSEATEQIARWFVANLEKEATAESFRLTKRRSPGYLDFDLSIQPRLVEISGGDKIGVSVNDWNYLIPRKSTTGIVGWRDA